MAEPKKYKQSVINTPVGLPDTSGIRRAGNVYAQQSRLLGDVADTITGVVAGKLEDRRKIEGEAAAAEHEFIIDPETGVAKMPEIDGQWSVFGEAYQKQIQQRYANRVSTDVNKFIREKSSEFFDNPNGFMQATDEYLKSTLQHVNLAVRGAVQLEAEDLSSRLGAGILEKKAIKDRKASILDAKLSNDTKRTTTIDNMRMKGFDSPESILGFESHLQAVRDSGQFTTDAEIRQYEVGLRNQVGLAQMSGDLLKIEDKDERLRMIEAIATGDSALLNKWFVNMGQEELAALSVSAKTLNATMVAVDNAEKIAAIADMDRGILASYGDGVYEFVSPEFAAQHPTEALSRYTSMVNSDNIKKRRVAVEEAKNLAVAEKEERKRLRLQKEDQSLLTDQLTMKLLMGNVDTLPRANRSRVMNVLDEAGDYKLKLPGQIKLLTRALSEEASRITAYTTEITKSKPIRDAFVSSLDGDPRSLEQNKINAEAAMGLTEDLSPEGATEDQKLLVSYDIAKRTGVLATNVESHLRTLSQSTELEDVISLAQSYQDLTVEGSMAVTNTNAAVKDLQLVKDFIADGGLDPSGKIGAAYNNFIAKKNDDTVYTVSSVEALNPDYENRGDLSLAIKEATLDKIQNPTLTADRLESSLGTLVPTLTSVRKLKQGDYTRSVKSNPAYDARIQKYIVSNGASLNGLTGGDFDTKVRNMVTDAVSMLQREGWGSTRWGSPIESKDQMVRNSPESFLTDLNGDSSWAGVKLNNVINKKYQELAPSSLPGVSIEKLKLGENVHIINNGKTGQYEVTYTTAGIHSVMVEDGKPFILDLNDMKTKHDDTVASNKQAEKEALLIERDEDLEDRKSDRPSVTVDLPDNIQGALE